MPTSPVHVLSQRLRTGESLRLAWCSLGAPALGESLVRAFRKCGHRFANEPGSAIGTDEILLRKGALAELSVVADQPATTASKGDTYGS
jgi:hypothetical protein